MTYLTKLISLGSVAFFVLLTLMLSWYTVPEGYRGVITRNAAVVGVAAPGLGFKVPFIDSVTDMSVQTQRVDFEHVESYSRDIQQSNNYVTVNYRLSPDVVARIYSEVGFEYAHTLLNARVFKHLKETYGKFTAAEIVNSRDKVSNVIEEALRADLAEFGVVVEDVQLANIDFSDEYEKAIEGAANAEANVKRERQELERIKVSAQQQVAQAEAQALAIKAKADADAYARTVNGNAEASAIAARGKALRDNPDLIALTAAEKWNGILPTTMLPNSTVPFVNMQTAVERVK
jgi:regulator of protease activity HflC (stomatin/prohibitin superfamily)